MTTDLTKLTDALKRDTLDKVLEEKIDKNRESIVKTLEEGGEYVLDKDRGIVISAA